MSELAVLMKWTFIIFKEVFAHLSLKLLLKCVKLALVTVEVVIIGLLSEVLQNLTRRVVEVPWSSLGIESLALVLRLWLSLRVK